MQAANHQAESQRKRFASWMHSSIWGASFDLVNCFLSLLSVAMYVIQTYYSPDYSVNVITVEDRLLMEKLEGVRKGGGGVKLCSISDVFFFH
jgi:hypothetical protein